MNKITISSLKDMPEKEILDILNSLPFSLLYVSPSYLRMLAGFLGCEVMILISYDEGEINGFFPLAFKHGESGIICNSLPYYGSNGGITVAFGADEESIRFSLFEAATNLIKEKKCIASTFISNPLDSRGNEWLKEHSNYDLLDERIGQITHFPKGLQNKLEEELIKSFENPRPRNIRKAIKEGVTVYHSETLEDLEFLSNVHHDNITAINGIPKAKTFFTTIPDYFKPGDYRVYIAEYQGQKVAALLLFYFNKTVEYFTPSVVEAHRNIQPMTLIIYQAMIDAVGNGYQNWNWGGTWLSQGGVYDFKKKWGTTDYRYFYYTRIYDESILKKTKQFLLENYPNFFVVPFSALAN